jgi:hypothetical protein
VLALAALSVACATSRAAGPSVATPTPTVTAHPTAAPTLTATATLPPTQTPQPAATSTPEPQPAAPQAPLISEVLATVQAPPAPTPVSQVRGGTQVPLPDGTTVVWGGCASDGECHWFNFYWAPTREVVMQNGEGPHKVQHELCHAHQHWSISGGAPLAPSDYDLESWYATSEGQSFAAAVAGLPWPWTQSQVNGLEDFAWTCAYWYQDPGHLLEVSRERYDWAAANLP